MIDGTPMLTAVLAATAACGRPGAASEPPPSAERQEGAAFAGDGLPQCPAADIAFRDDELPAEDLVGAIPAPSPWSALPDGRPAAPWIDTRHGLLLVPRPGATVAGPARWDVLSSRTGAPLTSFEVADPDALPGDVARWLANHGVFDDADEAALRPIAMPEPSSRQQRVDEPTGWITYSGPAARGDAEIDPFFSLVIPGRCLWSIGVGDEAITVNDEIEVTWVLRSTSMWIAPEAGVAVLVVTYQEHEGFDEPTAPPRFALSYRVLGGTQ